MLGTLSSVSGKEPVYLHTRIALADMDQDGLPEVMVGKNQLGKVPYIPSIRYFEGASLAGLKWEDQGLRLLWETRPLSGYAAGYQTRGLSGKEGRMQLFLAEVVDAPLFQFWSSPKTVLHRFVLEGR